MGKIKDRVGQKFGELTVIRFTGNVDNSGHTLWECQCSCGNKTIVSSANLMNKSTKSCGCKRHDKGTHKMTYTKLYSIWRGIVTRTKYKSEGVYHTYKEKNIEMCDEWKDFNAFSEWAFKNGYQDGLSIDRIDNEKGYSPDNCRWVTFKQQQRNKTTNRMVSYRGETKCFADWIDELNLNYQKIYSRIRNGWDIERAFTTP